MNELKAPLYYKVIGLGIVPLFFGVLSTAPVTVSAADESAGSQATQTSQQTAVASTTADSNSTKQSANPGAGTTTGTITPKVAPEATPTATVDQRPTSNSGPRRIRLVNHRSQQDRQLGRRLLINPQPISRHGTTLQRDNQLRVKRPLILRLVRRPNKRRQPVRPILKRQDNQLPLQKRPRHQHQRRVIIRSKFSQTRLIIQPL